MTDKLTLADCYKYPKARIFKSESFSYSNIYDFIYHSWESQYSKFVISDCKLILRSIEQLTDEENIELKKLYEEAIAIAEKDETMSWESSKTIVDYFRKIGVDIDGMFASGKAVKDE